MDTPPVGILDGNTFILSDGCGDISPDQLAPLGLYSFDTRHLSRWELTVNGERLNPLSVDDLAYFEARFFLVPGAATHYVDAKVSVIRRRWVGGSFAEELTVFNHDPAPMQLRIRMEIASDFADAALLGHPTDEPRHGTSYARVEEDHLRLSYERETFVRETIVSSAAPAAVDERGLTYDIRIDPHGSWHTTLEVETVLRGARGRDVRASLAAHKGRARPEMRAELADWVAGAPRLVADGPLAATYRRCLVDLGALRYATLALHERLPVAGLPLSMTFLGRDALLACLQTVPFVPQLSRPTLTFLAAGHGAVSDDFREEEPGKMLAEVRYGESAAFEDLPQAAYYGAADTTPLFVVLLDEYERWTGDVELVRSLEYEARRALDWVDRYADLTGRGYLAYRRRNERSGRLNQCWKDSPDGISYRDGRLPGYPLATCELQGYAYDAKRRGARLARDCWGDPAYAERLERSAADLRERFNRDFWIGDRGWYAAAVEADGTPVDSLTSNIGHLLWSGIVPADRADRIAELLMDGRLFSGWGVRTLATDNHRYNPIGSHTGMVWPFDNSFIAWGLRRYGHTGPAARIAEGILSAATYFEGRLPAAFAGYDRRLTGYPVSRPRMRGPYGTASGAPLLLLRVLLGIEPREGHLSVEPAVPVGMGRIELLDIPGRWGRLDAFGRGRLPLEP
ncbi:glycogen debranching N-terminal domain-containing protein [Plantactinospora siamensis]|uniref:Glycogen debranching N-terminal domain-containing protein n=1 Tax=Plantactinospora siamensis TaxID=555372 RepID=A0ABV6NTG9_9ACTN